MIGLLLITSLVGLQTDSLDTSLGIDEVSVVATKSEGAKRSAKGSAASIDEHLSQLDHVNLIRRGSYAWEPVVNNMQTERLSTTIDGMKIFYACTDKMDPVTSYVESGNLQSISLNSGLDGNPQSTGNIGGSLDLKLRKVGFDNDRFAANASVGHEWNGHLQVYGLDAAYSSHRFYTNFGGFFRHADNYKAGDGVRVDYSQFEKVNVFANIGVRLAEQHIVEATAIYDRANDVGYPALNMDVLKAEGFITSLSYKWLLNRDFLSSWETKAYYNHIVHVMDDTKRPDVLIHMDMPGDSWTTGLYSLLTAYDGKHSAQLNYDAYYNRQFADMTMYPGSAAPMYMVTWPDVGTFNTGLALSDHIALASDHSLRLSAKVSWQQQKLNNREGYQALKVFFPSMNDHYEQTTGRIAAKYQWTPAAWKLAIGAGWGNRAPTTTEAYGYYLNNTFDQYDYIGNPKLRNESAFETNLTVKWRGTGRSAYSGVELTFDANAFFFSNYIIGQLESRLSPMTVDAEGVKVFANLPHAHIVNTSLAADWSISKHFSWFNKVAHAFSRDDDGSSLPFVSPLSYESRLDFRLNRFSSQLSVKGNARQSEFASKYGETETPAYTIVNLNAQYDIPLRSSLLTIRAGVENLLDRSYSTYADWNKIPQKGRNVYVNLNWSL